MISGSLDRRDGCLHLLKQIQMLSSFLSSFSFLFSCGCAAFVGAILPAALGKPLATDRAQFGFCVSENRLQFRIVGKHRVTEILAQGMGAVFLLQHVAGAVHQQAAGEVLFVPVVGAPSYHQGADGFLFCFCKFSDFFAYNVFLLEND